MPPIVNYVQEIEYIDFSNFSNNILKSTQPLLIRGLIANWPAVIAGISSAKACDTYLRSFYQDAALVAMLGEPEINGRLFYNDDFDGFNFCSMQTGLDKIFDELDDLSNVQNPPTIYVGAAAVDTCLPGFRAENDLNLGDRNARMSIWIGNRTRIAAHYDVPDNVACVVAGHRKFTLFPPSELSNLYIGPLDFTPAGQSISLVDFAHPDFEKFPKFADALTQAQVAELGPGDAIFIPSMWWHHVESLDSFNVLVNYWWKQAPDFMDSPSNALLLAMLSLRDLPPSQRDAWQELFRHYVFEANENTSDHIKPEARRVLAPINSEAARAIRGHLLKKMNY